MAADVVVSRELKSLQDETLDRAARALGVTVSTALLDEVIE